MNLVSRRTLTPGRIVALSRQGERWWPHSGSASHTNTFRGAAVSPVVRLGSFPTYVALPLAAAGITSLITAHETPTYVLHAPQQASARAAPVLVTATPSPALVEPIADRDATATEFTIPFAEVAVAENAEPPVSLPRPPDFPLDLDPIASLTDTDGHSATTSADEMTPPAAVKTWVDPFGGLELEPELRDSAVEPSSGLLPDLDETFVLDQSAFHPVGAGDETVAGAPIGHRMESKLAQYQKEFPEIFTVAPRGASHSARIPSDSAKLNGSGNRKKAREAVARAEQWRQQRGNASNERRSRGVLGKLKSWLSARS